jgi:hypothetical protein
MCKSAVLLNLRQTFIYQVESIQRQNYVAFLNYSIIFCVFAKSLPNVAARGGAVFEVLRYKPEGRGIDSRWCHWNFSLT